MKTIQRNNARSSTHPRRVDTPAFDGNSWSQELQNRYSRNLAHFGKLLHKRHYISSTDGNLSVRLDEGHILTTPTGVSKGFMRPGDMVVVDLHGRKISGPSEPSSELGMHLTIYKLRPDIQAVVHAHPCVATAVASAGLDLTEPICSELVLSLGSIPLAPYALPGTQEVSQSLSPYIKQHDAILMQNHGVVAYGHSLERAYLNMESVEHCATIMLVTRLLGKCRILNRNEVMRLLSIKSGKKPNYTQSAPNPKASCYARSV